MCEGWVFDFPLNALLQQEPVNSSENIRTLLDESKGPSGLVFSFQQCSVKTPLRSLEAGMKATTHMVFVPSSIQKCDV